MVPDLLVLPPGVDLHNHPLVLNGSVFMQVSFISISFWYWNFESPSILSAKSEVDLVEAFYFPLFFLLPLNHLPPRGRQVPWQLQPFSLNLDGR